MNLVAVPILLNNYVWFLYDHKGNTLIVDPGESEPVLNFLKKNRLILSCIFLTHNHIDHTLGVSRIFKEFSNIAVYGPRGTIGINKVVTEGDKISFCDINFTVISTPGHTFNHVCYYSEPYLFCGDTLFSGGCGRIINGTYKQMFFSLKKINLLPPETLICCAHEYTQSNLIFASTILADENILLRLNKIKEMRSNNEITLPSRLKDEHLTNIFLMIYHNNYRLKISKILNVYDPIELLSVLRIRKDAFNTY